MRHADMLRVYACALLLVAAPVQAQQPPPSVPIGQRAIQRADSVAQQANTRQQTIDTTGAQQPADTAALRQAAENARAQQPAATDTLPIEARPATVVKAGDLQLKFDREVFEYPGRGRRDPFMPLTGADSGPLFTEIKLHMILYVRENPSESIVALSDATNKVHRLRRGDSLGTITVVDIGERRVVFSVNDFGIRRQEILELKAPGRQP